LQTCWGGTEFPQRQNQKPAQKEPKTNKINPNVIKNKLRTPNGNPNEHKKWTKNTQKEPKCAQRRNSINTRGKPKCAQRGVKNSLKKNQNTQGKIECAQRGPKNMSTRNQRPTQKELKTHKGNPNGHKEEVRTH